MMVKNPPATSARALAQGRKRISPTLRYRQLLETAIELASEHGYRKLNHNHVALAAEVSIATVFNYFNTVEDLHNDIVRFVASQFMPKPMYTPPEIMIDSHSLNQVWLEMAIEGHEYVHQYVSQASDGVQKLEQLFSEHLNWVLSGEK